MVLFIYEGCFTIIKGWSAVVSRRDMEFFYALSVFIGLTYGLHLKGVHNQGLITGLWHTIFPIKLFASHLLLK